jgi:hypothetical protein
MELKNHLKDLSVWKFPPVIDYYHVSGYLIEFDRVPGSGVIVFDLKKTEYIHASFIGFMIICKEKIEKSGGRLILEMSSYFQKRISLLGMGEYFSV